MSNIPLEKTMYERTYRNLRKMYPQKDGYKIISQFRGAGGSYIPDFLIKKDWGNCTEKIVVEVKREKKITEKHLKQINSYSSKVAGNGTCNVKKMFVGFSGIDDKILSSDFENTMRLRGYNHKKK